jgi:hypothetical protein
MICRTQNLESRKERRQEKWEVRTKNFIFETNCNTLSTFKLAAEFALGPSNNPILYKN